ncbi:MAG: hypothetical protein GY754_31485 [bacterium]|nr:hypothetical protein [bacterium]
MKKIINLSFISIIIFSLVAFAGCEDSGEVKYSTAIKKSVLPPDNTECPNGGVSIESGVDENGNGILDAAEVDNVDYICNGQNGQNGLNGTDHAAEIAVLQTTVDEMGITISGLRDTITGQAGTITGMQTEINDLRAVNSTQTTAITGLQGAMNDHGTLISSLQNTTNGHDSSIANLEAVLSEQANTMSSLMSRIEVNEALINNLNTDQSNLNSTFDGVTRLTDPNTGQPTIQFSGMNVQIVNGTGYTNGVDSNYDTEETVNGVGNLIVGYNEARSFASIKTGSHNIVLGVNNNYSSYGGLVAGYNNQISRKLASISGGEYNTACGFNSSVSGGSYNTASEKNSHVSGGRGKTADGFNESISGEH